MRPLVGSPAAPLRFPGRMCKFLRFEGVQLADPIKDQKLLSGPLPLLLPQLEELLELNITS